MRDTAQRIGRGTRNSANWTQLVKFGLVGGSGYVVNIAVFAALTGLADLHHIPAAIGAFLVAVTNNFAWNRVWTFREQVADVRRRPTRARGSWWCRWWGWV